MVTTASHGRITLYDLLKKEQFQPPKGHSVVKQNLAEVGFCHEGTLCAGNDSLHSNPHSGLR